MGTRPGSHDHKVNMPSTTSYAFDIFGTAEMFWPETHLYAEQPPPRLLKKWVQARELRNLERNW
jgi:hypothetical protein